MTPLSSPKHPSLPHTCGSIDVHLAARRSPSPLGAVEHRCGTEAMRGPASQPGTASFVGVRAPDACGEVR